MSQRWFIDGVLNRSQGELDKAQHALTTRMSLAWNAANRPSIRTGQTCLADVIISRSVDSDAPHSARAVRVSGKELSNGQKGLDVGIDSPLLSLCGLVDVN